MRYDVCRKFFLRSPLRSIRARSPPNERVRSLRSVLDIALKRSIIIRMDTTLTPRQITHDEKKAAEAAFAGRPFNPKWSDAARIVYDGLLAAMGKEARAVDTYDELEPVEPLA